MENERYSTVTGLRCFECGRNSVDTCVKTSPEIKLVYCECVDNRCEFTFAQKKDYLKKSMEAIREKRTHG